jgi:hypothetical protein
MRHFSAVRGQPLKRAGETVNIGETLWRGRLFAGRLDVCRAADRTVSLEPKRGDLVAFRTTGIAALDQNLLSSKRVVGMPGERIKIEPPFLNRGRAQGHEPSIFRVIASGRNGYHGFQLAQGGTFLALPTDEGDARAGRVFHAWRQHAEQFRQPLLGACGDVGTLSAR